MRYIDSRVSCRCRHRYLIFIFYIFIAAVFLLSDNYIIIYQEKDRFAYAHIFTDINNTVTKNIDKYQLIFLPYPNIPIANDNSTRLNFSLMENKTDMYSVFFEFKESGKVIYLLQIFSFISQYTKHCFYWLKVSDGIRLPLN